MTVTSTSVATIKRLFAKSGNRCSFPGCSNALVDDSGVVTGKICHIRARRSGGPRYDQNQSDTERNGFDNLMLLCPIHHDVIDSDENIYTVKYLERIKFEHENDSGCIDNPSDNIINSLIANTEITGDDCFAPASYHFASLIEKNFLYQFNGPESDYGLLLSTDLRKLFFYYYNHHLITGQTNRIIIQGREGSGKTFNALLLANQLISEGYNIYYCKDIRDSELTPALVRGLFKAKSSNNIYIVDNIQHDIHKAEDIVSAISQKHLYEDKAKFIFLTRPLDKDTLIDCFGIGTHIIEITDKLINLERLLTMFFNKADISLDAKSFIEKVQQTKFPGLIFIYKNMTFWNELLRSLDIHKFNVNALGNEFYKKAHSFYRNKEPKLLELRELLTPLMPFFCQGIFIHLDYATILLEKDINQYIDILERENIATIIESDFETDEYEDSCALFLAPVIHPTKAKIINLIYEKFYSHSSPHHSDAIASYIEYLPNNIYYILGHYTEHDAFLGLLKNDRVRKALREYVKSRHLGKKLDRVIRRFEVLDKEVLDYIFDHDVLKTIGDRVNNKNSYIVSKLYLFRAMQKVSPEKTYELFCLLDPISIIDSFIFDKTKGGITSLSKWMEVLKNIYYDAPTEHEKKIVQDFAKLIIDKCSKEFFRRFDENHDYFTQFHWMLKRLHGLKLGNYLLSKIEPQDVLKYIRSKDTNIVELRYLLLDGKYTEYFCENPRCWNYYDFFKQSLTYLDLKAIFDNKRSDLYDLAINVTYDFLALALRRYSDEEEFFTKVKCEQNELVNKAAELISTNYFFNEEDKRHIISKLC